MSDWMTPDERILWEQMVRGGLDATERNAQMLLARKADARIRELRGTQSQACATVEYMQSRIRELEAQVKSARQEALEEAAKVCEGGIDFNWDRSVLQTAAIKIRALARNEAQAKGAEEQPDCGRPCPPDKACDECAEYWHRMRAEGFWNPEQGQWTAKGWKEIMK